MEDLLKPHGSVLRNKGIGAVLYDMGLIEQWGSGISKMQNLCSLAGIPEPYFEEYQSGVLVEFRKDIYTEEYLRKLRLNERQQKAVHHVKTTGKITNQELRKLTGVVIRTASRDLEDLVRKGVLVKMGKTGRSTHYILAGKPDTNRTNRT
jgi:ATP-dependent DNA helicase RecG